MKTLTKISIIVAITIATFTVKAENVTNFKITDYSDLKESIKQTVQHDFSQPGNYLYKNGVDKLEEKVEIIFFINPDNSVRIMKLQGENKLATDYVKQLLNKEAFEVDESLCGKMYKMDLYLNYRAH
jgi:hypothetical protein